MTYFSVWLALELNFWDLGHESSGDGVYSTLDNKQGRKRTIGQHLRYPDVRNLLFFL